MPITARLALLRGWLRRAIPATGRTAGYLNWDTGHGFRR